MAEPVVGGDQAPGNNGLRQEGIVAGVFDAIRYGADWLDWIAEMGPNGGEAQGGGVAVAPTPELPPAEIEVERIAALARAVAEYRENADEEEEEEEEEDAQLVEGGVAEGWWGQLLHFVEVLRVRLLRNAYFYPIFFTSCVAVLWFGVTLGASFGNGATGATTAVVVPFDTAIDWGTNHTPQLRSRGVSSLAAADKALLHLLGTKYGGADKVILLAMFDKSTAERSRAPPGRQVAAQPIPSGGNKPYYGVASWLFRGFRASSSSSSSSSSSEVENDVQGYTGTPANSAAKEDIDAAKGKKNNLKERFKARIGKWRSTVSNARSRHGRDLARGVEFLSGE